MTALDKYRLLGENLQYCRHWLEYYESKVERLEAEMDKVWWYELTEEEMKELNRD